jgi:hypothetical protein
VCLFGVTVAVVSLSVRMKYVPADPHSEQLVAVEVPKTVQVSSAEG